MIAPAAISLLIPLEAEANEININIDGASAEVKKIMAAGPRRIAQVIIDINIPIPADEKTKNILEKAALTCPVDRSISESMIRDVKFIWSYNR